MNSERKVQPHLSSAVGALTERGGRMTKAKSSMTIDGLVIASVGDIIVTRDDGIEAA